jgi:hypothetical protein
MTADEHHHFGGFAFCEVAARELERVRKPKKPGLDRTGLVVFG